MVYSGMFTSVLESKAISLQRKALMAKLSYWYSEGAVVQLWGWHTPIVEGTLLGHLQ